MQDIHQKYTVIVLGTQSILNKHLPNDQDSTTVMLKIKVEVSSG